MAGIGNSREYVEKIFGFLKEKKKSIAMEYGENSNEYRALGRLYESISMHT